jgi:phosphoribosylformylglycinamidine cyclo-ligase
VLAEPHRSYLDLVRAVRYVADIRGLVHITGGGFVENIPRILPAGLGVRIDRGSWEPPRLFQLIQRQGQVDPEEMFRVFNMGIGMIVIVAPFEVAAVQRAVFQQTGETVPVVGEVVPVGEGPRVTL